MTVFQLILYSCVTVNSSFSGELIQKTCTWAKGITPLYAHGSSCEDAGKKLIGTPIFSDIADDRRVEKTKCISLPVSE